MTRNVKVGKYSNKKNKILGKVATEGEKAAVKSTKKITKSKKTASPKKLAKLKALVFSKKFLMVFLLLIFIGLGFAYYRFNVLGSRVIKTDDEGNVITCTNILNPECWTEAFKPQLKQTEGYTNALIIGLDTRNNNSGLKNTDSIIFASFEHATEQTTMISIPRDFYIAEYGVKINGIYGFTANQNEEDPFFAIKETVSEIVGKPIHYFATIRLDGVVETIDQIGGIEICTDAAFRARYPNDYPAPGESQWLYYDFTEGCQTLDGEKSLVYARFRYLSYGPSELASDFSRARRQQQVIEAMQNKLLKEDLSISARAERYWNLLETVNENVTVTVSFEDILAGLSFINTADRDPINVVLDPNFGGLNNIIYTDASTGLYTIKPRDLTYAQIHTELDKIAANADFYREQPGILVRNKTGEFAFSETHPAATFDDELAYYEFYSIITEAKTDQFTGIKVFDLTNGEKPKSLQTILDHFGLEAASELPAEDFGMTQSTRGEDFIIAVGPAAPTPTTAPTAQ